MLLFLQLFIVFMLLLTMTVLFLLTVDRNYNINETDIFHDTFCLDGIFKETLF